MYKASISDFLEIRIVLSGILSNTEDTKVRYGASKVLDRINKHTEITEFIDKAMDKKIEWAKEVDGKIVRDDNNEPEIKSDKRADYRNWFKKESEKLIEVEPYVVSHESFKDDIFLIEKLNGLLFNAKIEEML
jgi:hypothetical protein